MLESLSTHRGDRPSRPWRTTPSGGVDTTLADQGERDMEEETGPRSSKHAQAGTKLWMAFHPFRAAVRRALTAGVALFLEGEARAFQWKDECRATTGTLTSIILSA